MVAAGTELSDNESIVVIWFVEGVGGASING